MSIHRSLERDTNYLVDTCARNFKFNKQITDHIFHCKDHRDLDMDLIEREFQVNCTASMIYRVTDICVPAGVMNETASHTRALDQKLKSLYRHSQMPIEISSFFGSHEALLHDMRRSPSVNSLKHGITGECYKFVCSTTDQHMDRRKVKSRVDEEIVARGLARLLEEDDSVSILTFDKDVSYILNCVASELSNRRLVRGNNVAYSWINEKLHDQGMYVAKPNRLECEKDAIKLMKPKIMARTSKFLLNLDRYRHR